LSIYRHPKSHSKIAAEQIGKKLSVGAKANKNNPNVRSVDLLRNKEFPLNFLATVA